MEYAWLGGQEYFYAVSFPVWWLVGLLVVPSATLLLLPPWRRRFRRRRNLCLACGYSLTGNISGRCPECGADAARA